MFGVFVMPIVSISARFLSVHLIFIISRVRFVQIPRRQKKRTTTAEAITDQQDNVPDRVINTLSARVNSYFILIIMVK